jgi:hypothetical protein
MLFKLPELVKEELTYLKTSSSLQRPLLHVPNASGHFLLAITIHYGSPHNSPFCLTKPPFLRQRPTQQTTTFGFHCGAPSNALHSGRYQILAVGGTML